MAWSDTAQGVGAILVATAAGFTLVTGAAAASQRSRLRRSLARDLDLLERLPDSPSKTRLERALTREVERLADEIERQWVLTGRVASGIGGAAMLLLGIGGVVVVERLSGPEWLRGAFGWSYSVVGVVGLLVFLSFTMTSAAQWAYERGDNRVRRVIRRTSVFHRYRPPSAEREQQS